MHYGDGFVAIYIASTVQNVAILQGGKIYFISSLSLQADTTIFGAIFRSRQCEFSFISVLLQIAFNYIIIDALKFFVSINVCG